MSIQVNWTPIIVGVVAFAVGYLFAMLDRRVTRAIRKKGDDEVRVVEKIIEKPVPEASALSIVLDAGQSPKVRLDGTEVGEGLTAEQRKRMIGLLTLIRPLLEGKPVPAAPMSVPPAAAPVSAPKPVTPAQAMPTSEPVPAAQPGKSQPAPQLDEEDIPVKNSMVAQIDAILQEQIHGTPLENKGIHLMDAPGGGVLVYVGLTRYEGVGEVADPEIQAALRKAISAWEDKYTPGL